MRDHGIAAARLRSFGCGPFAPVTTNDTEDGRARNRRVELVKQ
ncbi:MAG: OmpA family protein [Longimicrobiales bacterium]